MSVILICWFGFSSFLINSRGRSFAALSAFIASVRSDVKLLFRITISLLWFKLSSFDPYAVICSIKLSASIVM